MFDSGFPRYMRLIFEHRSEYYSEIKLNGHKSTLVVPKYTPNRWQFFLISLLVGVKVGVTLQENVKFVMLV